MSSAISYIKNAQNGVSLSRYELEQIFENNEAHTLLCECLEKSIFKPYLFKEFVSNIKNGNLFSVFFNKNRESKKPKILAIKINITSL